MHLNASPAQLITSALTLRKCLVHSEEARRLTEKRKSVALLGDDLEHDEHEDDDGEEDGDEQRDAVAAVRGQQVRQTRDQRQQVAWQQQVNDEEKRLSLQWECARGLLDKYMC